MSRSPRSSTSGSHAPAIVSAIGHKGHVTGVQLDMRTVKCDLLVMSGSPQPNYKLLAQAGARVEFDAARGIFVPTDLPAHVHAAGVGHG